MQTKARKELNLCQKDERNIISTKIRCFSLVTQYHLCNVEISARVSVVVSIRAFRMSTLGLHLTLRRCGQGQGQRVREAECAALKRSFKDQGEAAPVFWNLLSSIVKV